MIWRVKKRTHTLGWCVRFLSVLPLTPRPALIAAPDTGGLNPLEVKAMSASADQLVSVLPLASCFTLGTSTLNKVRRHGYKHHPTHRPNFDDDCLGRRESPKDRATKRR